MEFSSHSTLAARRTNVPVTHSLPVRMEIQMSQSAAASYETKKKVVFVLGTTATGKSKLSIDLATHFNGEIINADKIQVYKGLDILTNKVPLKERAGIPHHLLDFVDPDEDYTPQDFSKDTHMTIAHILANGHIPIVTGGSNRYIEAVVEDQFFNFKAKYDSFFLWVDVALPTLYKRTAKRVDEMLDAGLVDEVRKMFMLGKNYNQGIWRSIGVQEMEQYFYAEVLGNIDENTKNELLLNAIQEIKENTNKLVDSQLKKIRRLRDEVGWKLHRIDATRVYERRGIEATEEWEISVLKPSLKIVSDFLKDDNEKEGDDGLRSAYV